MKLKLIFLNLVFFAVILSCKRDELSIVVNSEIPLLSKVNIDKQPYYEYVYNGMNLISEEKGKLDLAEHHYNESNQLLYTDYYGNEDILSNDQAVFDAAMNRKEWITPENSNKVGTLTYAYDNGNKLIRTTYSRPLSVGSEYSEYTYDANNRISSQILYWENNKTGYTNYSYDGKGNLIKETLYNVLPTGVAELSTTTVYEFDNEKNPYESFSVSLSPGVATNRNNITRETYTIHLGPGQGTENAQVTENSYVYNGNGYPVSKNGNVEYIYK